MKTIKVRLTGTNPLMFNNDRTVNAMDPYAIELSKLTSKKKKSYEDVVEIYHLKFLASCYWDEQGRWLLPANMIMASLIEGARENKWGTRFERSVFVLGDSMLEFECNGCTPEELWNDHKEYVDLRTAGIMKSKVIASRLKIPKWSAETVISFDENIINESELMFSFDNAGLRRGIGTYRKYFGRYTAEKIGDVKDKKKK